jgi:hypothetical protein
MQVTLISCATSWLVALCWPISDLNLSQGNEAWMESLESTFQREFLEAESSTWKFGKGNKKAGRIRSANGGEKTFGNYTFIQVFEAG